MSATLMSSADFLAFLDECTAIWEKQLSIYGSSADAASPVAGTIQKLGDNLRTLITSNLDNLQQPIDLGQPTKDFYSLANAEAAAQSIKQLLSALNTHISTQGPLAAAAITGIDTYLQYLNSTPYTATAPPNYTDLHYAIFGSRLDTDGVMGPAVHPAWNSAVSTNGMGKRAVGGSFSAGTDLNTSKYTAVAPLVEVVTNFASGATHPVVTVAGTDDQGATTTTWSVTFGSNNPTAAVSTTITPAVTAQARQTVAVASLTGIIAGSVLTVNSGLVDQEVVVVEAIDGGGVTITAVFQKAHDAGAAITGNVTVATTPSVGSRRCVHVSGITITVGTHDAGAVRVVGKQDRVPI